MTLQKRTLDYISGHACIENTLSAKNETQHEAVKSSSSASCDVAGTRCPLSCAMLPTRRFQSFAGLHSMKIGELPQRSCSEVFQSPPKRRRFHRRNSATSAMLTKSLSSILDAEPQRHEQKQGSCTNSAQNKEFSLEDGIKIAQGLVQDLRERRHRTHETECDEQEGPILSPES